MKTGKIKSIASLDKVLTICNTYGASYNPGNDSLKTTALGALLKLAQDKTQAVNVAQSAYALAVNTRQQTFDGIPKLAAQVVRMVLASKAPEADWEEARMIRRSMHFQRMKKKVTQPIDPLAPVPAQREVKSRSSLDRDSIMNNFERLIQLVQGIPGYKPNEPEFKVDALKAKLVQLQTVNKAAIQAGVNFSNARIARDKVIFGADGVVMSTRAAKNYIYARFGALSLEAKQTKPSMNF